MFFVSFNHKLYFFPPEKISNNSFSKDASPATKGGIGLQHIQKRLELIYPAKYTLTISEQEEIYTVKLWLQLGEPLRNVVKRKYEYANLLKAIR